MPENYLGINVKSIPVDAKEDQSPCHLCRFKDIRFGECDEIPCTENEREDLEDVYFVEVEE